jgi:hypothetical protein
VRISAERKEKSAREKLESVRRFMEKNKSGVSAGAYAQAEIRLDTALQAYAEGQARLEAGEYGDAFASFQKTIRSATEAELGLKTAIRVESRSNEKRLKEEQRRRTEEREDKKDEESPTPAPSPSGTPRPSRTPFLKINTPQPTVLIEVELETGVGL